MTVVGLQPISLRNATLTVAEDDYTQSVNEVVFVPQVEYEWIDGYDGTRTPVITLVRWVVVVGYAQDFTTPGSLAVYLMEHAAKMRTVTFTPQPGAGQRTISGEALIVPGQLGGVHGQLLTGQVTLPLYNDPVLGSVV